MGPIHFNNSHKELRIEKEKKKIKITQKNNSFVTFKLFIFNYNFLIQVKISNNLGDDIQYLVLVSSAPPKAKLSTGPARMHIQDSRFCITTGVPPKITSLWDIGYLR